MNVLVSGGQGYIGKQVVQNFRESGSTVVSLGRSSKNDISLDLAREIPHFRNVGFDLVIHLAGLAHVIVKNEASDDLYNAVNVLGTKNLLTGLSKSGVHVKTLIFASSVSVYDQTKCGDILETHATGANKATGAYGRSKLLAEDLIVNWPIEFVQTKVILRLPLVVGANAPGNLGKMIRFIKKRRYIGVGDGHARRSMVLIQDVLALLPRLTGHNGVFNLSDGKHPSFVEMERAISTTLGMRPPTRIPRILAYMLAGIGDSLEKIARIKVPFNRSTLTRMTKSVIVSDEKARAELSWSPKSVVDNIHTWIGEIDQVQ